MLGPGRIQSVDVWSAKFDAAEIAHKGRDVDTDGYSKDGWRRQELVMEGGERENIE